MPRSCPKHAYLCLPVINLIASSSTTGCRTTWSQSHSIRRSDKQAYELPLRMRVAAFGKEPEAISIRGLDLLCLLARKCSPDVFGLLQHNRPEPEVIDV